MSNNLLATLGSVKPWANVANQGDDIVFSRLIADVSRFILTYIQRPSLFQNSYTEVIDGVGQRQQILRNFPVLSVSSLTINGSIIPAAATPTACGYVLESWDGFPPGRPQALGMRGYQFCRGMQNIAVRYTAGFAVQNEPQTIPSSAPFSVVVSAPNGPWAVDQGVTYADGTALTPTTNAPAEGQYSAAQGTYNFAAADAGLGVLISYSYVPADIEQACIDLVTERYNYRTRVGTVSQSLGGQETTSYSQKDMPDYLRTLLQPYRRVILV